MDYGKIASNMIAGNNAKLKLLSYEELTKLD